ncbi:hypothetical protein Glove_477g13 [Diversispora epigaea]|uniref:Endonuclease/exonuclease/phosphatase domain-containing protein n=1 Tax=Diversispora epigaea TaxID=1348612 RepID=A0A397GLY7_9GLOM|nr:hypothetical protein Glove_477g13 [Diversispora epigaea]
MAMKNGKFCGAEIPFTTFPRGEVVATNSFFRYFIYPVLTRKKIKHIFPACPQEKEKRRRLRFPPKKPEPDTRNIQEDIKELNHWLENKLSEALSKDMVSIVLGDWNAVPNSRKDRFPSGKISTPGNFPSPRASRLDQIWIHHKYFGKVREYKIEDTDVSSKSDHCMVEITIDATQWIDNKQYQKNKHSKEKKKGLWRLKDATDDQWNKFESAVDKMILGTNGNDGLLSAGNQELPKVKESKNKVNSCNNGHKDFWLLSLLTRIHRIGKLIISKRSISKATKEKFDNT